MDAMHLLASATPQSQARSKHPCTHRCRDRPNLRAGDIAGACRKLWRPAERTALFGASLGQALMFCCRQARGTLVEAGLAVGAASAQVVETQVSSFRRVITLHYLSQARAMKIPHRSASALASLINLRTHWRPASHVLTKAKLACATGAWL